MKCIITGKETNDKTKGYPLHREARPLINKAKDFLSELNFQVAQEAEEELARVCKEKGIPYFERELDPKQFKSSLSHALDRISEGSIVLEDGEFTKQEVVVENKPAKLQGGF